MPQDCKGVTITQSPLEARLTATYAEFVDERPASADEDVHMLRSVVDHVIERCSRPGNVVCDPFAGFGTTLSRAVALGRKAIGIELLPERVEAIRELVPQARTIEGDARELLRILARLPDVGHQASVDLIVTSPPYMTVNHHDADPLTAYERNGADYARYLAELSLVAAQCARVVKPGGFVVWNVADIHHFEETTPLIDDCMHVLDEHFARAGLTEIEWDVYPHDLVRDALIVFRRTIP